MAKSNAQKKREHRIRQGKRDPSLNRGQTPDYSTHERKLPTRREKLDKQEKKYKNRYTEG